MKAIKSLVWTVTAVAGLALVAVDAQAQRGGRSGGGGGARGAATTGGHHGGGGHWSGGHGGHGGHYHGGHYGHGHYYYGGYYPYWGWGWGWPLAWSAAWYWGYPYYYDYYYPRAAYYYDRYPAPYPDGVMEPSMQQPQTTEVPHSQGAPTQAPAYMNYCDSSKAYYPKVTSCPEGWKFIPSR